MSAELKVVKMGNWVQNVSESLSFILLCVLNISHSHRCSTSSFAALSDVFVEVSGRPSVLWCCKKTNFYIIFFRPLLKLLQSAF